MLCESKIGERVVIISGENVQELPSQSVCPMVLDYPFAQRTNCFMELLSCLLSCQCAHSPAHCLIPLTSGSEASSLAGSFPDTPTPTLLILCTSTALRSLTLRGPWHLPSRFSRLPGSYGAWTAQLGLPYKHLSIGLTLCSWHSALRLS